MDFGNWKVTGKSIAWNSNDFNHFEIPINDLTRLRQNPNGALYDWVLLVTDESWLSQDDLYDFNYAFVFAAARYNLSFDYAVFDATLAEQYELLDDEEDDFDF